MMRRIRRRPIFVVDPQDEFKSDVVVHTTKKLYEIYREHGSMLDQWTVRYTTYHQDLQDGDTFFSFVRTFEEGLVVIDEVDNFCDSHQIPLQFKKLINFHRHDDITLIMAARRPADVHRVLTAQADWVFFFRMTEPADLEYVRKLAGKETMEKVRNLRGHQFLRIDL